MCITPESLALERSGRTVPFHNFIVEYKKNSNTIYYFVEGKEGVSGILRTFMIDYKTVHQA